MQTNDKYRQKIGDRWETDEEMSNRLDGNKWRIEVRGGGQIADSGDYGDPYYVLTDGNIELVTEDEIDEGIDTGVLVNALNDMDCK